MMQVKIIQGGMGIGVSGWRLAKAVSMQGQLGVVSGTALDSMFVRLLESGDIDGHLRRALNAFPDQEMANRVYKKYFCDSPTMKKRRFTSLPLPSANLSRSQEEIMVLANFAEVYLAKEGHPGKVGINLLEKIQVTILPSLYGAMLAGVDCVIMGAGIPKEIPGALDRLSRHQNVQLKLDVLGASSKDQYSVKFAPAELLPNINNPLKRPPFLAIISSNALALSLKKKSNGQVDGFIVEKPIAGGHNAPPRGKEGLSPQGEPVYGKKDEVNLRALKELGLPFWLAGGYGSAQGLKQALAEGAEGIQVGSLFALCDESGLEDGLKRLTLEKIVANNLDIKTDPKASPTGFPFKVAQIENTYSDEQLVSQRTRRCDLGYLRRAYKKDDGSLGYRCPAESESLYVKKGGNPSDTQGRKCLCNALMANIGLGQSRTGLFEEKALLTLGDDIVNIKSLASKGNLYYKAQDVIKSLMQGA